MKSAGSKELVAAGALLLAVGFGGWLLLRSRGALGTSWSDGETRYASETGAAIRHAVWDRPQALPGISGEASDPTLSPDGRYLVFASGVRGLNCELYVAELVDGVARASEPLHALDTPSDELGPAFGDGALYFASDRAGGRGGLDLWRAPYADGVFGPAEPLAAGLNSPADETDPTPLSGARTLLFASNRARGARSDFDLYRAVPGGREGYTEDYEVEPLDALNTPFDEREPALGRDARSLYFASDRGGRFDLYRALEAQGGWAEPAPVLGLGFETARAERGPWVTADGFALLFDAANEHGERELFRARSLELFLVPTPPVTLAEWLLLASLLALALLALLSRHWQALDILYKCFLVSLLVHLLLMLYLRTVYPPDGSYELDGDEGRTFRVELAPEENRPASPTELELQASRSLAAPAEPTREPFASASVASAAPELAALELPPRAADEAPAPRATALEPADAAATELVEREAPAPRFAASAPSLALAAPPEAERTTAMEPSAPQRAASGAAELGHALPAAAELASESAARDELERGARGQAEIERAPAAPPATRLASPAESFERAAAAAPELALSAAASAPAPVPAPRASDVRRPSLAAAPTAPAAPLVPAGRALSTAEQSSAPGDGPARERLGAAALSSADEVSPTLRAPTADAARPGVAATPTFDATADLAAPRAARANSAPAGPERRSTSAGTADPATAAPLAASALPSGTPAQPDAPRAPERTAAPSSAVLLGAAEPALRAPKEEAARAAPAVARAPAFDAGAGLGGARVAPAARDAAPAPARAELPIPERLAPIAAPAATLAPPAERAAALDQAPPPRLSATPYQNRYGAQKLRALEEFGGTPETEQAVARGLAYLARIQESNGAWGQRSDAHEKYLDVRIGKTGLALLALLGAGHVPDGKSEHAAVAERAVRFLLGAQDAASGHFGRSCSYGHGIATYALAECYALTQDERLRAPLEAALAEILRHQDHRRDARLFGGFGYYFADDHVWNGDTWPRTSVTAWQVMALESASLGGLAVPEAAFRDAREFLLNTWDESAHAFRYNHDPERLGSGYPILPASTPAALFALALLDVDPARAELAAARRFVLTRAPDGYRFTGDADFVQRARGNLYFWYYATLALFRVGGKEWEHWNAALKETLLPAQDEDGSWRPIDTYSEYAGDEDEERTYTTALCVLSLEIYYRYFTPLLRVK